MSTAALLNAARTQLLESKFTPGLTLTEDNCRVMDNGQPHAMAGSLFVALHFAYWRDGGNSNGLSLDTEHGFNVTVSMRRMQYPNYQVGEQLVAKMKTGLLFTCERIAAAIHIDPMNLSEGGIAFEAIMKRANDLINDAEGTEQGFVEPIAFIDGGQPQRQPGSWWDAKGDEPFAGMSQTMSFGKARRVQTIESED